MKESNNEKFKKTNFKKVATRVGIAGAIIAGFLYDKPIDPKVTNTNAYVLTVNAENTNLIDRLKVRDYENDFEVLRNGEDFEKAKEELVDGSFGILAITGHHLYGTSKIYGTYSLNLNDLPKPKSIETVIFSACKTAGDNKETKNTIYNILEKKYPNLKMVIGFESSILEQEGITSQVLSRENRRLMRDDPQEFIERAVRINTRRRLGVYHVDDKKFNGKKFKYRGPANLEEENLRIVNLDGTIIDDGEGTLYELL